MDIYSAEKYLEHLLQLVKTTSQSDTRMYSKSRARWKSIASTCQEVSDLILKMLSQTASSENDLNTHDINTIIQGMQDQISRLTAVVKNDSAEKHSIVTTAALSPEYRRQVLYTYRDCFLDLSSNASRYRVKEAYDLSVLLNRWFQVRFIDSIKVTHQFRYNIRRFPEWVSGIIIIYAYHISKGDISNFESCFESWIDTCYNPDKSGSYSVPIEVYDLLVHRDSKYLTTGALVLYDILSDMGMNSLFKEGPCYLSDEYLYNLYEDLDPTCLDLYVNYKSCPDIIIASGFHFTER